MESPNLDIVAKVVTEEKAVDVLRIPTVIVNAYAVGDPSTSWVLVDTGLPGFAGYVQKLADAHAGRPPAAIILTHGHFDHAGNVQALAEAWNVPVYAHPDELPFLTGVSDYPPADPSMGGAIAQFSRAFPAEGIDLGDRVNALPADGSVPGLIGWRWLHTPGHSPGHISLFRESDRYLISGDAIVTMDMDNWLSQITFAREIGRPPVPFTPDWDAAEESIRLLAELRPWTIAAGHGQIMEGQDLADELAHFAAAPHRPDYGRYALWPATFSQERGVVSLPAPVEDKSLPFLLGAIGGIVVGGILLTLLTGNSDKRKNRKIYLAESEPKPVTGVANPVRPASTVK